MFELPEYVVIANQMNKEITERRIISGFLGNSPHKFVWYNRTPEEFTKIVKGKTIGRAYVKGRWLFLPLDGDYVLVIGECGGKINLVSSDNIPSKYHLLLNLDNEKSLFIFTQMWGGMMLFKKGEELQSQYIKDMNPTPLNKEFTLKYFRDLVTDPVVSKSRSVKSLLTQDQLIPGLGNSIAQDIMLIAGTHPKALLVRLQEKEIEKLYEAIITTVNKIIKNGGRYDEYDLYGNYGQYKRMLDKQSIKTGCPVCGGKVDKIQYLGGSAYFCDNCQKYK